MKSYYSAASAVGLASPLARLCVFAWACAATPAFAATLYEFGFETNPGANDWSEYSTSPGPPAQRTTAGGGILGLTPSSGTYYYETYHDPSYVPYGSGGYGYFNIPDLDGDPNYNYQFSVGMDIYIDPVNWSPPTNPGDRAFTIDSAPGLAPGFISGEQYNAESSFDIRMPTAGQVDISANNSTPVFASIVDPGWYTFALTFRKSSLVPTDLVVTDFAVYYANGGPLVGSILGVATNAPFENQKLGGANYIWLPLWQDGFANNVLGIDNLFVSPIPEPSTFTLLGLAGLGTLRWRRRQA